MSEQQGHDGEERWSTPRKLWLIVRARHVIADLEAPLAVRDSFPALVFVGTFVVHAFIGAQIQRRGGFDAFNYFFNADCPRVIDDMMHSHLKGPAPDSTSSHPLFPLLTNPVTLLLSKLIGDTGTLTARLVCHAAAAGAAVVAYWCLRQLRAPRWLAMVATLVFSLSATLLVFGSIVETFAFVPLVLAVGVLVGLRSTKPLENVFAQVLALGVNTTLVPHSVFTAPLLWTPRLPGKRWATTTLAFLAGLAALSLGLAELQEHFYTGSGFFFLKNAAHVYESYWLIPKTREIFLHRASRLVPHFFTFSVVAPKPLFTGAPEKITTFLWMQKDQLARYDTFGAIVAAAWVLLLGSSTIANLRSLRRGDGVRRAVVVLLAGWLLGTFGFFMVFGDDLFLYSPLWILHLVLWVALGVVPVSAQTRPWPWAPRLGFAFVALLALSNAKFIATMLGFYG